MSSLLNGLLSLSPALVCVLVATLVFCEDALFIGFVIPGETAAVLGGVDASRHNVSIVLIAVIVVLAAIVGDTVGYQVGRHGGNHLLESRFLENRRDRIDSARGFLSRRGGSAVFLGRFIAFFRAVMPALAGISHMPYRRFMAWNATGGLCWGVGFVVLGYVAGNSYAVVARQAGQYVAIAAVAIAIAGATVWHLRKRSRATE
jgi:membrane-associated protein